MTLDLKRDLTEAFTSPATGFDLTLRSARAIRQHAKNLTFYGPSEITGECLHQDTRNPSHYDETSAPDFTKVPLVSCGDFVVNEENQSVSFVLRGPAVDGQPIDALRVSCFTRDARSPEPLIKIEHQQIEAQDNGREKIVASTKSFVCRQSYLRREGPDGVANDAMLDIQTWLADVTHRAEAATGKTYAPRDARPAHVLAFVNIA